MLPLWDPIYEFWSGTYRIIMSHYLNRHGQLSSGARGLHFLQKAFIYIAMLYVLCVRVEKARARLCLCIVSPESSLLPNAICFKTLWSVSYSMYTRPKKKRRYVWKVLTVPCMYFIKRNMHLLEKIEQNGARECSLPVSQLNKTLVLPWVP